MLLRYIFGDSLGPRRHKTKGRAHFLWAAVPFTLLLVWALVFSAPSFYPELYAIQVSPANPSDEIASNELVLDMQDYLAANNITYQYVGLQRKTGGTRVLELRFDSSRELQQVRPYVEDQLGTEDYIYAYNTVRVAPRWLRNLGARPINLGLDLRGGVYFLMQVDTRQAVEQRIEVYTNQLETFFRQSDRRYLHQTSDKEIFIGEDSYPATEFVFADAEKGLSARDAVLDEFPELKSVTEEQGGLFQVRFYFPEEYIRQLEDFAIDQNIATLRERINELGVSAPSVNRQGRNRVAVQIPGLQDTAAAKRIIGSTANLEFRLETLAGGNRLGRRFSFRSNPNEKAYLEPNSIVTGANVINALVQFDENNFPQVAITLDGKGGRSMNRATRSAVGRNMGVLLVNTKVEDILEDEKGELKFVTRTEKEIISLATIRDVLGSRFVITGLDGPGEASELALLLRSGALAAPIYFVEERTIGPSLGQDNIRKGSLSLLGGALAVILFILFYYKLCGLLANIALVFNMTLILAIMTQLNAVLTMPGIAGIVLTVGMAVDANILIFSRIKEELKRNPNPTAAITAGYDRALITVLDANITTLLVGIILFAIGTGAVKGFAVTLSIGILTSLFTSVVFTRKLMEWIYAPGRLKKIYI